MKLSTRMNRAYLLVRLSLILAAFSVPVGAAEGKATPLDTDVKPSIVGLAKGWVYSSGDDLAWADPRLDDAAWQPIPDTTLKSGLPQGWTGVGWFRLRVTVPPALSGQEFHLQLRHPGASEAYLDGQLVRSFGTIGATPADDKAFDPRTVPPRIVFSKPGEHVLAIRYYLRESLAAQALASGGGGPGFSSWLVVGESVGGQGGGSVAGSAFAGLLLGIGLVNFILFAIDMRRLNCAALAAFAISMAVYTLSWLSSSDAEGAAFFPQAIQIAAIGVAGTSIVAYSFLVFKSRVPAEIWLIAAFWIAAQITLLFLPFGGWFAVLPSTLYILGFAVICGIFVRFQRHASESESGYFSFDIVTMIAAIVSPALFYGRKYWPDYQWYMLVASGGVVLLCATLPTIGQLLRVSSKVEDLELRIRELKSLVGAAPSPSHVTGLPEPSTNE